MFFSLECGRWYGYILTVSFTHTHIHSHPFLTFQYVHFVSWKEDRLFQYQYDRFSAIYEDL
jgi:hypothetical protein